MPRPDKYVTKAIRAADADEKFADLLEPLKPTAPRPMPGIADPFALPQAADFGEWSLESGLAWESDREALINEIRAKRAAQAGDRTAWRPGQSSD